MQMITQEGNNVYSVGVEGNFDDAQSGVKAIFTNKDLIDKMEKSNYKFSSANSINWEGWYLKLYIIFLLMQTL